MACLENLPPELLERILCCNELMADDLKHCALTAPCFRLLHQDTIWERKLKLQYPSVRAVMLREDRQLDTRSLYSKLCSLYEDMCLNVLALSNVFVWSLYHDYEWPDIPHRALVLYLSMFDEELGPGMGKYYVLDECYNIIHGGDRHKNLTLKYYAQKVYCFVNCDINFDSMWRSVSINPAGSIVDILRCPMSQGGQFNIRHAANVLAFSIPMNERVDESKVKENIELICSSIDHSIMQYRPDLLKNNLRSCQMNSSAVSSTLFYNRSECVFLLKQIHDCLRHEYNFKSARSSVYQGYKHCLDKVLLSRVGDHKLLVALEGLLAQHYSMCVEIHEHRLSQQWKLYFKSNDGRNGYYECPSCSLEQRDELAELEEFSSTAAADAPLVLKPDLIVITERMFHRRILESLVTNFENRLKNEWQLAGGPIIYDLLSMETFANVTIRHMFSAWKHVEHWKIARLRHYSLLLKRVSDDCALDGKILHLDILLRVHSNRSMDALANFKRDLLHPPAGIRDLQRMVASVNIRARARLHELNSMLTGKPKTGYFLATFHPITTRPWPHGWPGSDMVQKRRVDRKSWHVQFAVGQVVEIVRHTKCWCCGATHLGGSNRRKPDTAASDNNNPPVGSIGRSKVCYVCGEVGNISINFDSLNKGIGRGPGCFAYPEQINNLRRMGIVEESTVVDVATAKKLARPAYVEEIHSVSTAADLCADIESGSSIIAAARAAALKEDEENDQRSRERRASESGTSSTSACCSGGRTRRFSLRCRPTPAPDSPEMLGKPDGSVKDEDKDETSGEPPRKMDRRVDSVGCSTLSSSGVPFPQPANSSDDGGAQFVVKPRASGQCVVYDWDSMCVESEETLYIMGETNLLAGTNQPFYRVLLDDGSSSYVAQENLQHAKDPRPVNNPLLGRYFRAYVRPYYIPNMQKAYEYPEDATIREQDAFVLALL